MKYGCKFCESCYKCPLNWDCKIALEDQSDYEHDEGIYEELQLVYSDACDLFL